MLLKTYKIYGRNRGDTKAKERYLFTTSAANQQDAVKTARRRVKGAYIITKARAQW